ncbi:MAG: PKD domain-containing protein [Pseudomonadota bacterium]
MQHFAMGRPTRDHGWCAVLISACALLTVVAACSEPPPETKPDATAADAGQDAGPNSSPIAVIAGPSEVQHPRGFLAELDGTGSSDPDGDPLYYFWSVVGPTGASQCTTHQGVTNQSLFQVTPPCDGNYTVLLFVQDARMASSSTVHVLLQVTNQYYAEAGDNRGASLGQTLTLSAAASVLPTEPGIVDYNWALLTRPPGSSATIVNARDQEAQFTPTDPHASYEIALDVSYNGIRLTTDRFFVNVLNSTPVASAGDDTSVSVSGTVALDGSMSMDPDGDGLSYAWVLQGPTMGATLTGETTATPSFTAGSAAGSITVQLTVSDVFGGVDSDTVVVTVQ